MPGLPSELHQRCRQTLLKCSEFDSNDSLRAIFATSELHPFRDRLREASSRSERVDACLGILPDSHLGDGRPVLPLFLEALRDRYQEGDALRDEIEALIEDVRSTLGSAIVPLVPELPGRTPRVPSPGMTIQLNFPDPGSLALHIYGQDRIVQAHPQFSTLVTEPTGASQHLGTIGQPTLFLSRTAEQINVLGTLPSLGNPALWFEGNFVGREYIIQQMVAAADTIRLIVVLGIPSVGKTALMAQIASRFDPGQVFGYRFRPGLISLDDVLINLARFLDSQPGCEGILADAIQASRFSKQASVDLVIKGLNAGSYYLFFDSIHLIMSHSDLNSFFIILKEQLRQGAVFVAGRSRPDFYTPVDDQKQLAISVELGGLHEPEIIEFFGRKGISLTPEVARALDTRFGALPLALELMVPLLQGTSTEAEFLAVADKAEGQVVDYLFAQVHEQLDPAKRELLITASLLNFPFSRDRLIDAHRAIFGGDGGQSSFLKLREQLLIQQFAIDLYQVHEVISALALKHTDQPSLRQTQLADYLAVEATEELESQLEAILLYYQAGAYDQAAELLVPVVDLGLLEYAPDLAETILSGFREEMVSPDQWVWLIGSRGNLAHLRRQYDEAENHYKRMLQIAEELEVKTAKAIALQRLGILYLDRDEKVAEKYYRDSLDLKKELGDLEGQAQLYNNLGSLYAGQSRLEEARAVLQKGLDLLESIGASEWQKLSIYGNLGHLYATQEQWEEANEFTEKARQIAEEADSPCDAAKSTYNLGRHEAWQGNQEAARERYEEALEIAEACGCWEIEELAQIALGRQDDEQGNYDEAIAYFQKVAEIRRRLGDTVGLTSIIFDIGTFYWHKGDHQSALSYYEDGINVFEHLTDEGQIDLYLRNIYGLASQSGEPRRLVQALKRLKNRLLATSPCYKLAEVYGTLGQIYLWILERERVGLACLHQKILLLTQLGCDGKLAQVLNDLGVIYQELGYYGDALDTGTAAIDLVEKLDLLAQAGIAYYNRGNCFATLEAWQQAEDDYHHALATAEKTGNTQLRESVYHNLGEVYRRQGRLEEAVNLLQPTLGSAHERGDVDDEVRTLNNLGLAHQALHQDQEALVCFNDALKLSRQHDLRHNEADVLISLGNFYLEREQPERAKDYYEEALHAARATEDVDMEEGSMLSLAYAHRQLGTFDGIAEDFKVIAERAGDLKHYENLLQFLVFAGEMNAEEKDAEATAGMFEQALIVAAWVGYDRLQQLGTRDELESTHFLELFRVIYRICGLITEAMQNDEVDYARTFYDELTGDLRSDAWAGGVSWFADLLKPLEDYIIERPQQSAWEFIASAWAERQ